MGMDYDFDQWVADEGGPDAVVEMIADLRRKIEDGLLPGFTSKDDFFAHLGRPGRQSA